MLLRNLSSQQKNSLFALLCICLSQEYDVLSSRWVGYSSQSLQGETSGTTSYTYNILHFFIRELDISDNYYEAYFPLINVSEDFKDIDRSVLLLKAEPFLQVLFNQATEFKQSLLLPLMLVMVTLIVNNMYDSKARVMVRTMQTLLQTKLTADNNKLSLSLFALEEYICFEMETEYGSLKEQAQLSHIPEKKSTSSKMMRYAKIGAVSIGAGAAIALTGGLAAPAIAAVWGGFAFLTSAGVAVSLFGSAGAGFAGYKMMRRTRELSDFSFESFNDPKVSTGRPAVVIFISGYVVEDEDYKRAFGAIPSNMTIEERLIRFFRIHDPSSIDHVSEILMKCNNSQKSLQSQVSSTFGKDFLSVDSLTPEYRVSPLEDSYKKVIVEALRDQVTDQSKSTSSAKTSQEADCMPLPLESISQTTTAVDDNDTGDDKSNQSSSNQTNALVIESEGITYSFKPHVDDSSDGSIAVDQGKSSLDATDGTSSSAKKLTYEETAAFGTHFWHYREANIAASYEPYLLRWELPTQKQLGIEIVHLITNISVNVTASAVLDLMFTSFAYAIFLPLTLFKLAATIDGVWTLSVNKADEAGKELAKALLQRPQGSRPVTLVGYSMGARVIFSCLSELYNIQHQSQATKDKESTKTEGSSVPCPPSTEKGDGSHDDDIAADDGQAVDWRVYNDNDLSSPSSGSAETNDVKSAFSESTGFADNTDVPPSGDDNSRDVGDARNLDCIIQDVVLLGTPISYEDKYWKRIRKMVSGRIVNGYSKKDVVLSLVYRYYRFAYAPAGVEAVVVPGIENIDLSHIVVEHLDYRKNIKEIMDYVDLSRPFHTMH